jgi:hypothetical protein
MTHAFARVRAAIGRAFRSRRDAAPQAVPVPVMLMATWWRAPTFEGR